MTDLEMLVSTQRLLPNGKWVPAKPLNGPFFLELKRRVKRAWWCLNGKATAIRWY